MRVKLTALVAAATIAVLATAPSNATSSDATHDRCRQEDGSGQRLCVWNASTEGNGVGDSFVAVNGGTARARYIYITDARAYRLTH